MTPDEANEQHLDTEQIAAYLDRNMTPEELPRVEAHIAECERCRREALAATRIVGMRARRRWLYAGAPLVAAVVASILLVSQRDTETPEQVFGADATVRTSADEGLLQVTIVAPAPGSAVRVGNRTFRWRSLGTDVLYRFTLTNQEGEPIFTGDTSDSALTLPGEVALEPDARYFWRVDALLPDGRSATTRMLEFHTTR